MSHTDRVVYQPREGYDPDALPEIEIKFVWRAESPKAFWWRPRGSSEPWRGPVVDTDPQVRTLLERAGFERTRA